MTIQKSTIHHAASEGYTATADNYVRGRPGYPDEVMDWLHNDLKLQAGTTVVDLGAGTGKFTTYLVQMGADVVAVEPVPAMLAKISSAFPQVKTLKGTADSIPLADASVDVVVCAQAFHWFATHSALTEIHRVLKPGGRLGLIWNMRDARVDWVARLNAIVDRVEGDTPRYYKGTWRQVFPHTGFGPLHEQHFSIEHKGTAEDVILNRVRSTSFIAALPTDQQAKIESEVAALIAGEPTLAGFAEVIMPYETAAFYVVKVD